MKWYLVFLVIFSSGGIKNEITQGYTAPVERVQIEMPSLEVCRQIAALRKFGDAECWARADAERGVK